ncbi:MAG: ABC transporter substrate-binding protein [Pseudomonadota bacterium]
MRLRRLLWGCVLGLVVTGCQNDSSTLPDVQHQRPMRIVSLDVCADQYVVKLVDRERILGVSPDATRDFSYMREEARGLPVIRPIAEDVLVAKPDLVVRAYGGGPGAASFFTRAGIPMLSLGWAASIPEVFAVIEEVAKGLGESERGEAVVAEMRERLAALQAGEGERTALYMTPSGVTTGPGSLIHDMLLAAGLDNFQRQSGWRPLPLERLAYETPDLVAAAFFDTHTSHTDGWSPMRHPVARAQIIDRPTVAIPGAWTACAGWFLMDGVEALAGNVRS